jgi:hypothetical protein
MDTKGSDVRSCFAADPKDTEMPIIVEFVKLALVDGSNTELTLDSRDQWRSLEKRTGQRLEGSFELSLATRNFVMEADHANVFFSCTLLRLYQASSTVNANNQTASNLRVKGSTVSSFLRPESTVIQQLVTQSDSMWYYLKILFIQATTS